MTNDNVYSGPISKEERRRLIFGEFNIIPADQYIRSAEVLDDLRRPRRMGDINKEQETDPEYDNGLSPEY